MRFFPSDREQDEKAEFFHCIPFYVLYLVRRSPLFYRRKSTVQSPVFPLDRRDQTLTVTCGHLGFSLPRSEAPRLIVVGWGRRLLPTPSPFPRPLGSFFTPTYVPLGTFETKMALRSFSTGFGINALTVLHPFPSAISTVPSFVGCITPLEVRVNNLISPEAVFFSSRLTNRSASFDVSTSLRPIMLMYYVFLWKSNTPWIKLFIFNFKDSGARVSAAAQKLLDVVTMTTKQVLLFSDWHFLILVLAVCRLFFTWN